MLPRLLLVDDETNLTRALAIGLRIEGFDVETASDARGALAILSIQRFDLAIVDLMMPGISGMELARMLRERHPALRVLLTSAYHLSEPQLLRADCGAIGFVPKPIELAELARLVRAKLACAESAAPLGGAAA